MGIFAGRRAPHAANIVLVHGLWADGSSWSRVIPPLQAHGHFVVAAQNPLTSVDDDVAATQRILAELDGPTILVGHSYGGFVISAAANDAPGVAGLVYIAAFAPEEGETLLSIGGRFPPLGVNQHLLVDAQGVVWIDPEVFPQHFGSDVEPVAARTLAAAQKPAASGILSAQAGQPAWQGLPSWYLVASEDRMIQPEAERWMARRIKATTREVAASHAAMVSQPDVVADLILAAAQAVITA